MNIYIISNPYHSEKIIRANSEEEALNIFARKLGYINYNFMIRMNDEPDADVVLLYKEYENEHI